MRDRSACRPGRDMRRGTGSSLETPVRPIMSGRSSQSSTDKPDYSPYPKMKKRGFALIPPFVIRSPASAPMPAGRRAGPALTRRCHSDLCRRHCLAHWQHSAGVAGFPACRAAGALPPLEKYRRLVAYRSGSSVPCGPPVPIRLPEALHQTPGDQPPAIDQDKEHQLERQRHHAGRQHHHPQAHQHACHHHVDDQEGKE